MGSSAKLSQNNDTTIHTCNKCEKESVITLTYGPHYFCENHFTQFFEDRFRKTVRKYDLIKPKEKIVIALSGGKDSTVLLHLMAKFYNKSNKLTALIIDEGVKGYRDNSVKVAEKNCKLLHVPYKIFTFKEEFGITNDKIMPLLRANPKLGGTCAFCGTLRRNVMNKYAKKLSADKLATGHNLDDESQSFVMNVFNNDFERMKRMGAHAGIIEHNGFVKRIKPLYETPEQEIIAYCAYKNIEHYSQECCPYSWTAKRNEYREMINNFDDRFPGTKYSLIRFYENLKDNIKPTETEKPKLMNALHECKNCGEPTEKEICKACEMINTLKQEIKSQKKGKITTNKSFEETHKKKNQSLTCTITKRHKTKN